MCDLSSSEFSVVRRNLRIRQGILWVELWNTMVSIVTEGVVVVAWLFQINLSDGGVPKLPVPSVVVHKTGAEGDRQRDLKHHGGPDRALCIYSLEIIMALQQEGHPIFPGATGENLTFAGIEWHTLQPGLRMKVGLNLEIEMVSFTEPCRYIKDAFIDGAFVRILQDRHPGWSRLYARVLTPGKIRVGDPVIVVNS